MIYDPATGALWTSDGTFLKHLYCPKGIRWDELGVTRQELPASVDAALERSRDCTTCKSKVTSLEGLSDEQVTAVFKKDASACVYLRTEWTNVTVLQPASHDWRGAPAWPTNPEGRVPGIEATLTPAMRQCIDESTPRVHTARTLEQINAAAAQGLRVLLKPLAGQDGSSPCGQDVEVWQNEETGEVQPVVDLRGRPDGPRGKVDKHLWRRVLSLRNVYPYSWPNPFAAYLVPKDLAPGAFVLLTDPIEDIAAMEHWGSYRARMVPATWTGSDVKVHARHVVRPHVVG